MLMLQRILNGVLDVSDVQRIIGGWDKPWQLKRTLMPAFDSRPSMFCAVS